MKSRFPLYLVMALAGLCLLANGCTTTIEAEATGESESVSGALGGDPSMRKVHAYIPYQSLETYTLHATEIVEGTILSTEGVFPDGGLAYTEVILQVTDVLKGGPGDTVPVRIPGAESEDEIVVVSGAPNVQVGDHVLVFLWKPSPTTYRSILGLGQGLYTIQADIGNPGMGHTIDGLHAHGEHSNLNAFKHSVQSSLTEPMSAHQ
jgi:hypothetical protein